MHRDEEGWMNVYREKDAFWLHNGNPKFPHALLTSDKHSNGFFNSRLVIPDDVLMREAASDLIEKLNLQIDLKVTIEMVTGPQTGATKLAMLICDEVAGFTRSPCLWSSPAKGEIDEIKVMIFNDEDQNRLKGKSILLCEDVLTTGGSVDLTVDASVNAGGTVLPYVLVLVNRSGLKEVNGKKIIALIDREMPMWEPDDCPLCKQGSVVVRPKDNWNVLTALY